VTPPCHRFEREGLLLLERGQPIDESLGAHLEACLDCREARRIYESLHTDLARLGKGLKPPAGWQEAVRHRIQTRGAAMDSSTPRSWAVWGGLAAAVLVIAVLSLILLPPSSPPLTASLEAGPGSLQGSSTLRGDSSLEGNAHPGDLLVLKSSFGSSSAVQALELRLYRNDRTLVARCPGSPGCEIGRRQMRLTVSLPAVGTYQPVLIHGPAPLPEGGQGLDPDSGAVLDAGGQVQLGREIEVR